MIYERLREIRNTKGLTAKEIADALNLKTEAAYYKKETGMVKFTINEAKIVSDLFDMPIEEIFFANDVSSKETKPEVPTGTEG